MLLALLGLVLARRRRKDAAADGLMGDDIEPALGGGAAAEWNDAAPEDSTFPNPKATGEDVDPLAEAEIFA